MSQSQEDFNAANSTGAATETDVIVIGVGTCGEDLSLRLLGEGLSVVGIEASLVGGECAYWACLPSKLMIRSANLLQEARRVNGLAGEAHVIPDWGRLASRVRAEVTGGWDDSYAVARFKSRGGRLVHGRGKIVGPRTVAVGDEQFTARRGIVISIGSKARIPSISGLSEVDYWTSHDVIQAETLPDSLIVLGGGVVGCELGQLMARFGSRVTIIEASDRLMPWGEPEASEALEAAFTAEDITVQTGSPVQHVRSQGNSIVVELADGQEIVGERLLVATGRTVDLSSLGIDTAGLDSNAPFLEVDDRMRAADGIWAMGDVTGKAMFTHVALYQSAIVAADILGEDHPAARYDAVPRAAFTDPEVGAVGMTEADARAAGLDVIAVVKQLPASFRGWLHGSGNGVIKLIADRKSGVLVGATAVGPRGGEMLGMLSLAVHAGVPLAEMRSMIYAFPTFYGAIGEAIGAYGRGLSTVIDPPYQGFLQLDEADGAKYA